ncbi:MAG: cytochrome P450 [Actinomycetota bacterium]
MSEVEYDLFADTAVGDVRDPYPEYAQRRAEGSIFAQEFSGEWYYKLFRYQDVAGALRDPQLFSSSVYEQAMAPVMGTTILAMDGNEHHLYRSLIAGAFRRKALESWEQTLIESTVQTLIDRFSEKGEADLVQEFTFQFPIRVISGILGVPPGDEALFMRLSIELISWAVNWERGKAASNALREYFTGIIAQRRASPKDDLISALVSAEIDGHKLDDEHIFGFINLLMPAGAETTYRLIGSLLFALLSAPSLLERVRSDRSLIPKAIEECLRWESPVQFVARRVMSDTEISDTPIAEGSTITCVLGSANRDETVFEDPDRFDLDRSGPPPHLAFAEGPHRCLGEHLARMETTVALNALLDRLPNLKLDPGDRDPHVHGLAFRSPNCLPVRFA